MLQTVESPERPSQALDGTGWTPRPNGLSSRGSTYTGDAAGSQDWEGAGMGQAAVEEYGGCPVDGADGMGASVDPHNCIKAIADGVSHLCRRHLDELLVPYPHSGAEGSRELGGAKRRRTTDRRRSCERGLQERLELALDFLAAAMPAGCSGSGGGSYAAAPATPAGDGNCHGHAAANPDGTGCAGDALLPRGSAAAASGPPAAVLSALAAAPLPRFPSDLAERLTAHPHQPLQRPPAPRSLRPYPEDGERDVTSADGEDARTVPVIGDTSHANPFSDTEAHGPSTSAALRRLLAGSGPLVLRMADADAGPLPPVTRVVWLAGGDGGRVPLVLVQSGGAAEQQE